MTFIVRSATCGRPCGRSELDGDAADESLRWARHEQFVVNRRLGERLTEQIANGDEHLPLGAEEVHEGERLTHLHVPAAIEAWPRLGSIRPDVRAVQLVEHEDARGALRQLRLERRREVVHTLELVAERRRHTARETSAIERTRIGPVRVRERIVERAADVTSERMREGDAPSPQIHGAGAPDEVVPDIGGGLVRRAQPEDGDELVVDMLLEDTHTDRGAVQHALDADLVMTQI